MRKFEKKQQEEERKMAEKIAREERKILIAQRKLESIRLITVLFEHIKVCKSWSFLYFLDTIFDSGLADCSVCVSKCVQGCMRAYAEGGGGTILCL